MQLNHHIQIPHARHAIHENHGAMECKVVAQNSTNEKDIEFKKCEEHISHDSEQQRYNFLGM
jgi:hypothetical protein